MQDDEIEGEPMFGRMRLVLGAAAAIVLPVWLIATVTYATVSEELRYYDGGDPTVRMVEIDPITGEERRAERSSVRRFALAGFEVALWLGGFGLLVSPLLVGGVWWSGRREAATAAEPVLEDALVEGAHLEVSVRHGAEVIVRGVEPTFDDSAEGSGPLERVPLALRPSEAEPTYDDSMDALSLDRPPLTPPHRPADSTFDDSLDALAVGGTAVSRPRPGAEPTYDGTLDVPQPSRPAAMPRRQAAEPTLADDFDDDEGEGDPLDHLFR